MKPKVSAIIANRNGAEHLRVCLPSLLAQSYQPVEIAVVDNGSSDASEAVAREFGAKWLPLGKNLGLAPALNRGSRIAEGELLLFINNDMRFDRDFVAHLVFCLDSDERVFAADGMQFNWDGTAEGHLATTLARTRRSQMAIELVPGLFLCQQRSERPREVFMASAASMLVRRSFFEALRGFDERLPLSYEDVDICWRARLCGWKSVYVPEAVCWHRVGASSRSTDEKLLLFRGILRGRLLIATKYLPVRYALLTWVLSAAGFAKDVARTQWKRVAARCKEMLHLAFLAPKLLAERRAIHAAAGRSPRQQLDRLLAMGNAESRRLRQPETGPVAAVSNSK